MRTRHDRHLRVLKMPTCLGSSATAIRICRQISSPGGSCKAVECHAALMYMLSGRPTCNLADHSAMSVLAGHSDFPVDCSGFGVEFRVSGRTLTADSVLIPIAYYLPSGTLALFMSSQLMQRPESTSGSGDQVPDEKRHLGSRLDTLLLRLRDAIRAHGRARPADARPARSPRGDARHAPRST